jgi:acyl-coenzyme A synthetase/AMP-(fatty) acid ligase/acyl carrier protein
VGPRPALVNTYGPTEATIVAAMWKPPGGEWEASREVPIGRPVSGARIFALDQRMELAPIGVPGELYIGGGGLARGYLGAPELTAARFVPSPWDETPGARLYRTGDLGRYRADGTLEFLGRLDHQVKVRGFRIELGEIERALAEHPDVAQAVATLREDLPGQKQIVAYIVGRHQEAWQDSAGALRAFLAARLPDYMIPAHFVPLGQLPVGASGKVDRAALPAPDRDRAALGNGFVAPRTPIEERLAAIWAGVLDLGRVGIHDNFFHLGGHSLLLTQVLYQVQKSFQMQVPLRALMEQPTIAELALTIEELMLDELESLPDDDAEDRLL